MRISDWSSDVCSSDLFTVDRQAVGIGELRRDRIAAVDKGEQRLDRMIAVGPPRPDMQREVDLGPAGLVHSCRHKGRTASVDPPVSSEVETPIGTVPPFGASLLRSMPTDRYMEVSIVTPGSPARRCRGPTRSPLCTPTPPQPEPTP